MIQTTATGIALNVRVTPRAKTSALAGVRGTAVVVRVASPPVDGAANRCLVRFLADVFSVPIGAVRILHGASGRDKRVAIDGVTADAARRIIEGGGRG